MEFLLIPGVGLYAAESQAIRPKLCKNCAFLQNFHTRKLGEICAVYLKISKKRLNVNFYKNNGNDNNNNNSNNNNSNNNNNNNNNNNHNNNNNNDNDIL